MILSTLASTAHAERRLKDHLGGSRALPPAGERISFAEKAETEEPSDPNSLLKDPQMLVRFIKANPSRLSVDAMNPALVLTITRVLIDGGALFIAERLLSEARQKWSDRSDIIREHSRMLIQLGRLSPAIKAIKPLVDAEPEVASNHFIYAFALVRKKNLTVEMRQTAIKHFEDVLRLDPNYVDNSGMNARNIKNQLTRMKGETGSDPVP